MSKTLGEAIRVTNRAYANVLDRIKKDDGNCPARSRRLKLAEEKLDAMLDGLYSVGEWE
jgi:hypothetical protein